MPVTFQGIKGEELRERALAMCEDPNDPKEVRSALAEVLFEEVSEGRFKVEQLCVLAAYCIVTPAPSWFPSFRRHGLARTRNQP